MSPENPEDESPVRNILLISEDRTDIRYIEQQFMDISGLNCRLLSTNSVSNALEKLENKGLKIDAIILDARLSGLDNPETLFATLKRDSHDIPIIILTSDADEESEFTQRILAAGAAGHIHRKRMSSLVRLIGTILFTPT